MYKLETYLEEGDLDAAAREMNSLQGWAKTLSRDWLGEVRKVLEVQQALDVSTLAYHTCYLVNMPADLNTLGHCYRGPSAELEGGISAESAFTMYAER